MYNNDPQKVLTGECRLSYCHLCEPFAQQKGAEEKYSVTLLIPKLDTATKADIDQSIQAAIEDGIPTKWKGFRPAMPKVPIHDGDGLKENGEPYGDECKGHWVMTASSKDKPQVVHISNIRNVLAPIDIYSGMHARVTIRFFAYEHTGKRGIGCGLGNVLKTRDDEPLSGRSNAESDFAGLEQPQAAPQAYQQPAYPQPSYPQPQQPAYPSVNPVTGLPW